MSAVAGPGACQLGGLTDDELVQLARGGHEPAFDAIVLRYRAPLVSYSRRWLDPHRAEEVVQHTFMKAYLCLRDDDRPLILRPWLYRVTHNAALNAVEKKGSDWEELDENYDGVPQPPQVAEQRAQFLTVVEGIGALPARQRDALLLNEFEGRCYADIADELGTSESGVRGLLRRARRQLRETAALLLPLPALREVVRSDPGRLHVDRAGELIGSAGAAGGAGVAGGLTKVACGMLAAGTIAGGGTAIEHQRERARSFEAKAAAAHAHVHERGSVTAERTRLFVADGGERIVVAVPIITSAGAHAMVGASTETQRLRSTGAIGTVSEPAPAIEQAGDQESAAFVLPQPPMTFSDEPAAEDSEEKAAGDEGARDKTADEPKQSSSGTSGSGSGGTTGTTQPSTGPAEGPAAVPATPVPSSPQRQ